MSKPYDASTKYLLEYDPLSWVRYVGLRNETHATVIDADLSTVTADADKVILIGATRPWLLHLELQSSYEVDLPLRVGRYNVLLEYRHRLPVWSVVILLRPDADGPVMTGRLRRTLPSGVCYDDFQHQVVRAWDQPVADVLAGGLATLPLAPIANVQSGQLPEVVRQMEARLNQEAPADVANSLWTASYILMGLRYPTDLISQLLQGVRGMKESVTYQAILAEGKAEGKAEGRTEGEVEGLVREAQKILLHAGRKRLGPPDAATIARIELLTDLDRLEGLIDRVVDPSSGAASWEKLLSEG